MRKYTKRGFTLIELLVVIAVIGILSSIVLVSLAGARDKARDAKIQSDIGQVRPLAEMINDNEGKYKTLCVAQDAVSTLNIAHAVYTSQLTVINNDIKAQNGNIDAFCCNNGGQKYCVYSKLNVGTRWYCADATGNAGVFTVDPVATCNATSFTCAP